MAGYVFGAFRPATGDALTATYEGRTTANWIDFLSRVEAWIGPAVERVYAVLDNLNCHSGPDVLLFNLGLALTKWRASVSILRSDLKDTGALEAE